MGFVRFAWYYGTMYNCFPFVYGEMRLWQIDARDSPLVSYQKNVIKNQIISR